MPDGMPLSDVRVIDAGQVVAGPVCATYLADMGADVIKLEAPRGDIARGGRREIDGEPVSTTFELLNRSKRSVSVNLKEEKGREVVYELVKSAQIFIQNWPPGVAERLGVDFTTLKEYNEDLVYTHVTGFGETGPMANKPAMDTVIQHVSGLSSLMGYEDHPPIRAQTSLGDYYAGTNAAFATMNALRHAENGNGGQKVEISMLEGVMHNLDSAFEAYNNVEDATFQKGGRNTFRSPQSLYGAAETKDGWVCVAFYLSSDRVWRGFCEIVDRPDLLEDPKYEDSTNRNADAVEFSEMLEDWMRERSSEECLEKLSDAGIPVAPHNTIPETAEMEHVKAREVFREVPHPRYGSITLTRPPFRLSDTDPDVWRHAPFLGEHTEEVLAELGFDDESVASLADENVIIRD